MLRKVGEMGMIREFVVALTDELETDAFKRFDDEYGVVQELIRCKDCIYYRYYGLTEDTVSECTIDHCENPNKDWYCADGERKSAE